MTLTREQIAEKIKAILNEEVDVNQNFLVGIDEATTQIAAFIKERDQQVWDAAMTKLADIILDNADSEVDNKTEKALRKLGEKKYTESDLYTPIPENL